MNNGNIVIYFCTVHGVKRKSQKNDTDSEKEFRQTNYTMTTWRQLRIKVDYRPHLDNQ